MRKNYLPFLLSLLVFIISCTCLPGQLMKDNSETIEETIQQSNISIEPFGEIIFCLDVLDDGTPVESGVTFPAGTTEVWAYFTYQGMEDGTQWGQVWKNNNDVIYDERNIAWEDGEEGWVAYSVTEDDPSVPLSGQYSLTLYYQGEMIQSASFFISETALEGSNGFPALGTIQFATGITDDYAPYGAAASFEYGITEVYAVFPFINMEYGMEFRREWLLDGEIIAEKDLNWEEDANGVDYASLYAEEALDSGVYTLNLYLDGQLSRSAAFEIIDTTTAQYEEQEGPGTPEELIDDYMMPAWENLAYSHQDILRDLAQFALDYNIRIYVDEDYDGEAAYQHSCSDPPVPGEVVVSLSYWQNNEWALVTSALGHELTHAVQHISNNYPCSCSIEKEYYAWITGFYVLQEMGRMDILDEKYRGVVYDWETGKFDGNMLWERLKEVYSECPEY